MSRGIWVRTVSASVLGFYFLTTGVNAEESEVKGIDLEEYNEELESNEYFIKDELDEVEKVDEEDGTFNQNLEDESLPNDEADSENKPKVNEIKEGDSDKDKIKTLSEDNKYNLNIQNGIVYGFLEGYESLTNIEIPSEFNGDLVTEIASDAFYQETLETVRIPNTITKIGSRAFSENKITSINIPSNLKYLGDSAFYANSIKDVNFPKTLEYIGSYAFYENNLEKIVVPEGITEIKEYTFYENNLKEVTLPNNLTEIGTSAFYGNNIGSIELPSKLRTIKDYVFFENNISDLNIPKGVQSIGSHALYSNGLENVTIPSTVKEIEIQAFGDNNLTEVVLPEGLTELSEYVFYDNNLTKLVIPESIVNIKEFSLYGNNLTSIRIPDSVVNVEDYAFFENNIENIEIGLGLKVVGNYSFYGNNIKELDLGSNVKSIGEFAFDGNYELEKLTLNSKLKTISQGAFYDSNLKEVQIPNSVESIGDDAFVNEVLSRIVFYGEPQLDSSYIIRSNGVLIISARDADYLRTMAGDTGNPFLILDKLDMTLNKNESCSIDDTILRLTTDKQTLKHSCYSLEVKNGYINGDDFRLDVTATPLTLVNSKDNYQLPKSSMKLNNSFSVKNYWGDEVQGLKEYAGKPIDGEIQTVFSTGNSNGLGYYKFDTGEPIFSTLIDPATMKLNKGTNKDEPTTYKTTVTWSVVSAP